MKKLTSTVLAVVLTSSFAMVSAQNNPSDSVKATDIEEVVVTALGIKREKKAIGYAAQEVSGDILSDAGQVNALSSLSGNVAGVQVTSPSSMGGSTRITMRGVSSLTGENRPLIIVDGIPLDNSNVNSTDTQRGAGGRDYGDASFDINPDDIESVTVLKGGPAAALYGSRATNGVIIYTTKSAKRGKASVELNTGISFESLYIRPRQQKHYGGGLADTMEQVTINGQVYNIADYGMDESWGPKYDPNLMYLPWNAFDPEFANDYMKPIAWMPSENDNESFFKTGIQATNNISISKSFDKASIRASYTNTKIDGVVPNSSIQKHNFSLNTSAELSDRLKAEAIMNFVQTHGFNRPEQGYGDNSVAQKMFQWGQTQLDYSKLRDYKLANGMQRTWNRSAWNDGTPLYSDNPYWTVYENTASDKRNRIFGTAGLTYDIKKNLYVAAKVYADVYSQNNDSRVAVGSQAVSGYNLFQRTTSEFNYEGRIHWNPRISDDFTLNAFAGGNIRNMRYEEIAGTTVGGLRIPNYYNLKNSIDTPIASNYMFRKAVNSVFGSVSLGFKDFLYLEGTARNDWFSTVSEPEFYPSLTGSFVFSNVIKAPWMSFGKIRAGWASVASDTNPYLLDNYFNQNTNFGGEPTYVRDVRFNTEFLKPELKETKEIGLEMNFLKNRIGFDVTYYDVKTTDGILPLAIDPSTGFTSMMINAGEMRNKGVEATVFVTPIKTKDFTWNMTWNFAKNENEVVRLHEEAKTLQLTVAPFRVRLLAIEGQSYGQIYGTDFVYDDNGNKVVGANGRYVASGLKNLGSTLPDYTMGLRNTFNYKNFSLSFLLDMQKGGSYFSTSHMWGMYTGVIEESSFGGNREAGIVLDGVKADGSVNDIKISAQAWGSSHYGGVDALNVFSSDYIKLRDVTIGYSLPKALIGNFLEGVRFSVFGRNLLAWNLDWKNMDPENTSYGSGNIQGLEGGSLPSTRQVGFNVNFKF